MQDDSLFAFAGTWDRWKDVSGNAVETCSILTTTPNSLLAEVHDRMRVILQPQHYDLWLDPGFKDLDTFTAMLKPFDPTLMKCVSSLVNCPANDNQGCAAEIEMAQDVTESLF
jgi:putative SOS response-associated peptidase YedK